MHLISFLQGVCLPYQDCSKFDSGSDWETEVVFSCGSLIAFETSFGTLEACWNILLRLGVTLLMLSYDSPTSCCFFQAVLGLILWELGCIRQLPLFLSEGRQYSQGRVFKCPCPQILARLQIPLWRLCGWGPRTLLFLVCTLGRFCKMSCAFVPWVKWRQ